MSAWRRLPRAAAGVAVYLALLPVAIAALGVPPAAAHGGYPIVEVRNDKYAVAVLVTPVQERGAKERLDITTYLIRQDLGEPDLDAEVELRITDNKGTRVLRPKVITDGYETILPGESSAWRKWRIEVRVAGAAGTTVVTAEPRETYTSVPLPLIAVLGVVTVIAGVISIAVLRRRVRSAEAAGAGKPAGD